MPKSGAEGRCEFCSKEFNARGLATHQRSCQKVMRDRLEDEKLARELRKTKKKGWCISPNKLQLTVS